MITRLSYLVGFNVLNNHPENACGPLLDDYWAVLLSQEVDVDELGSNRINTVKAILKDLIKKCPARRIEISNTKKQFIHTIEEK
jgi:hypothetical protein